ncbi:MAG: hypothetical protein H6727_02555 [Myxococcales bacterium]|nr:hypothetical protein [Myxococcales bacterium]
MKIPIHGKPRVTKIYLIILLFSTLLLQQLACVPQLNLDCDPCFDGTCGINNGYVCKEGFCVPESNPDPTQCKKNEPDGGSEKVEVPEEATNPEESVQPEEGGPIEQEPTKENGPEPEPTPEIPEADKPTIVYITGNGTGLGINRAGANLPNEVANPGPNDANKRIRDGLVVGGALLGQVTKWVLAPKDTNSSHPTLTWNANENDVEKGSDMTSIILKFSMTKTILAAGFFILTGTYTQGTVQAQIYVLQGEKGNDGKEGAQGPAGPGFDATTQQFVQNLQSAITFTTDTITVTTKTFKVKGSSANGPSIELDDANKNVIVTNANLHIRSGSGTTNGTTNGYGNVIIGYNEDTNSNKQRGGSHNLILGQEHSYTSYGSILSGTNHTINAPHASAIGGDSNTIGGNAPNAVAIAGQNNQLAPSGTALYAAALGGQANQIDGNHAAAVAGQNNTSSGNHAAAVAGQNNTSSGNHAAAVAGQNNTSSGNHAAAVAGQNNTSSGNHAAAVAGQNNTVSGTHAASVGGGGATKTTDANQVTGDYAVAIGGKKNELTSDAENAVISGGTHHNVGGPNSVVVGGESHQINKAASYAVIVGGGGYDTTSKKSLGNQTFKDHTTIIGGKENYINASSSSNVSICGSSQKGSTATNITSSVCCQP